ncbi:hypothetical protein [Microbacterium sp. 1.5R]|uniref:hypothetical protein n=1 Tax=Microbacterium sp. 1.5R TaxID=1916917 RepID=UPI0011A684FB|nr:hypothetical protein [Microbacterium sp. 1.5R]
MAASPVSVTTGQKTHRCLRLSLVLVVFALLAAVTLQSVVVTWQPLQFGWHPLASISHAFYTPVRDVFVGSLIAASVALLALSGRTRAATLLDVCAVFAPLIAIVPTGIADSRAEGHLPCPAAMDCIPGGAIESAKAGVAVYAIAVAATVVVTAVIRARTRTPNRAAVLVSVIAVVTASVVSALAFVPSLNDRFPFNFWPVHSIHFVVTLAFFGVFAAVPLLYAGGPLEPGETPPTPRQRATYRWIAGLLIADLVFLVTAVLFRQVFGETPALLIGEAAALLLFAWFWLLQTFQRWNDENPPSILAPRS